MKEDINVGPVGPYLEFKSTTPMTITPNYTNTGRTLQYSLDTVNWVNIAAKAVTPSANVIYFSGSAIIGADTFYLISCWRRSKLNDIGAMVEDGEHVRKSIQYPGTIFITKTSFGGRGRI